MFQLQLAEISLGWYHASQAFALLWPYAFVLSIVVIVAVELVMRNYKKNK